MLEKKSRGLRADGELSFGADAIGRKGSKRVMEASGVAGAGQIHAHVFP